MGNEMEPMQLVCLYGFLALMSLSILSLHIKLDRILAALKKEGKEDEI
jgi:hypothetical protein